MFNTRGSTVDVHQADIWKNKNVINQLPQYEQAMASIERKAVYNFFSRYSILLVRARRRHATSGDVRLLCGFTAETSSTQLCVCCRRTLSLRGQLALVVLLSKAPRLVMLSFTTIVAELRLFGGLLWMRLLLLLLQNPLGNHARKAVVDGERHKAERVEGIVDTAVYNRASALR